MATFKKDVVLYGNPTLIPEITKKIETAFLYDDYDVNKEQLAAGGVDISVTKGGVFRTVLGLKTALKITLTPQGNTIHFVADVGIFGQQVIPTLIMWFYLWPVLITQIWGLVRQSKLDDKALEIANTVIAQSSNNTAFSADGTFCPKCGNKIEENCLYCPKCGCKLD